MDYDKNKHKPLMIKTSVKNKLDIIKKELILESLNNDGTGRVSYGDTIEELIKKYKEDDKNK